MQVSPEARQYFALAQDATLYTVAPLDYETHSNHTLLVMSARTSDIYYVQVQVREGLGVFVVFAIFL